MIKWMLTGRMTSGISIYFATENVQNFPLKFSKPKNYLTSQSQSKMSLKDMAIDKQMLLVYIVDSIGCIVYSLLIKRIQSKI